MQYNVVICRFHSQYVWKKLIFNYLLLFFTGLGLDAKFGRSIKQEKKDSAK